MPENNWIPQIRYASKTDVGLRRANNQDFHDKSLAGSLSQFTQRGHLFAVADGMGAHAAGEVASRIAVESVLSAYSKRQNEAPHLALQEAVYEAHQRIREQSDLEDAFHAMGTTLDALLLLPNAAYVAHVGDSRVYRLRNNLIEQLTADHSLVWEICKARNVPFRDAPSEIPRNQITRSLGPTDRLKVDIEGPFPVEIGDTFLLCSDGLSGLITDSEMGQMLSVLSPEEAVESFINVANLRGGNDNITCIVVNVTGNDKTDQHHNPIPLYAWVSLASAVLAFLTLIIGLVFNILPLSNGAWIATLCFFFTFLLGIKSSRMKTQTNLEYGHPYGNGPYLSALAVPEKQFSDALDIITYQFRVAALQQFPRKSNFKKSPIWENINLMETAAKEAAAKQQFGEAIRSSCLAINLLMQQLKQQKRERVTVGQANIRE